MRTPQRFMKASHLNHNVYYDAVSLQVHESFTVYNFLTGESSVFILQREFSGSSEFMEELQTYKVKLALILQLCVTVTITLHNIILCDDDASQTARLQIITHSIHHQALTDAQLSFDETLLIITITTCTFPHIGRYCSSHFTI